MRYAWNRTRVRTASHGRAVPTTLFLLKCLSVFLLAQQPHPPSQWAMASSFTVFLDHTQRHTTVGRTPLDEWSALAETSTWQHTNTHYRQTSMPTGGIRTHNLSRRSAADPRLRRHSHWDRKKPLLGWVDKLIAYESHFALSCGGHHCPAAALGYV